MYRIHICTLHFIETVCRAYNVSTCLRLSPPPCPIEISKLRVVSKTHCGRVPPGPSVRSPFWRKVFSLRDSPPVSRQPATSQMHWKKSLATYVTKSRKNILKSDRKSSQKSIKSHPEFDPKWRKSEPQSTPKRRQMVVFNSAPPLF